MTSSRCEIFYVRRTGKVRWKWRATANDGSVDSPAEEYELFYECLSAARKKGFTPTYAGLQMFRQGDPSGLSRPASGLSAKKSARLPLR